MTHELKIHPEYFRNVLFGLKKVEIRKNDRNYQERDLLELKEYDPESQTYTGNQITKQVNHIIKHAPGLDPDYVLLQISNPL